jgi:hypothetical protein
VPGRYCPPVDTLPTNWQCTWDLSTHFAVLLLLPKHLPGGLSIPEVFLSRRSFYPAGLYIGIKAIVFTPFPSGSVRARNVPVWAARFQRRTQVLSKLFDGRSAKKPVAVVDLEYYETRLKNDDMTDHRIMLGVRVHDICLFLR